MAASATKKVKVVRRVKRKAVKKAPPLLRVTNAAPVRRGRVSGTRVVGSRGIGSSAAGGGGGGGASGSSAPIIINFANKPARDVLTKAGVYDAPDNDVRNGTATRYPGFGRSTGGRDFRHPAPSMMNSQTTQRGTMQSGLGADVFVQEGGGGSNSQPIPDTPNAGPLQSPPTPPQYQAPTLAETVASAQQVMLPQGNDLDMMDVAQELQVRAQPQVNFGGETFQVFDGPKMAALAQPSMMDLQGGAIQRVQEVLPERLDGVQQTQALRQGVRLDKRAVDTEVLMGRERGQELIRQSRVNPDARRAAFGEAGLVAPGRLREIENPERFGYAMNNRQANPSYRFATAGGNQATVSYRNDDILNPRAGKAIRTDMGGLVGAQEAVAAQPYRMQPQGLIGVGSNTMQIDQGERAGAIERFNPNGVFMGFNSDDSF